MIKHDQQIHVHKAIILELTMRTLERNKKYMSQLKSHFAFELWIDEELRKLHKDLRDVNRTLGMHGLKVMEETKKIDEYFIRSKGNNQELRYSVFT
ncbi:hypothetical protein ACQKMD_12335 [Viridibacillus sp. NPDC096237]|uniref:hypothetical protein n=1 Tax=Viridibacillus sp. NPDC096237 TaxID=3390721 RepID=UPI003D095199